MAKFFGVAGAAKYLDVTKRTVIRLANEAGVTPLQFEGASGLRRPQFFTLAQLDILITYRKSLGRPRRAVCAD